MFVYNWILQIRIIIHLIDSFRSAKNRLVDVNNKCFLKKQDTQIEDK